MNISKIAGVVLCLSAGLMLFLGLIVDRDQTSAVTEEAKINLALRQVAHSMYTLQQDSTSSIPPVQRVDDYTYRMRLEIPLYYDSLPTLVKRSLASFDIAESYMVAVRRCGVEDIILGFNDRALLPEQVPCTGREVAGVCHEVDLIFTPKKKQSYIPFGIAGLFFLGAGVYLLRKPRELEQPVAVAVTQQTSTAGERIDVKIFGESQLNTTQQSVTVVDKEKPLTYREYKLLAYFAAHQNTVLKREDIQAHVWEDEGVLVGRSLDVFVSRLRKILKDDTRLKIVNVHSVGYRLEVQ